MNMKLKEEHETISPTMFEGLNPAMDSLSIKLIYNQDVKNESKLLENKYGELVLENLLIKDELRACQRERDELREQMTSTKEFQLLKKNYEELVFENLLIRDKLNVYQQMFKGRKEQVTILGEDENMESSLGSGSVALDHQQTNDNLLNCHEKIIALASGGSPSLPQSEASGGLMEAEGVFPPCKLPPHKRQLDALLSDTRIDRSVSHLLGYTQLNTRLRQTGSYSPQVKKKVIVVDSTVSEESDSDGDSGSEYNPATDMSRVGDGTVLSGLDVQKNKRQAINDAKKAKLSKGGSGSKGKAAIGSSSPCVTGDETVPVPAPARKVTVDRVRVARSPTSYDVDRCVRWEAPLTGGGIAADAQSLPLLPRPCNAQGFGVIGAPPQYAYDVIAPYMTFGGDVERVQSESLEDSFGFLLENSAEQLARLSIYSRSMLEGKREMDARYQESQTRYQEIQTRYQECQTEVGRMQGVIDQGIARQNQLVKDAIAAYDSGLKEGSVDGWHEAVKAYREAGHLDPSVVDSVPCHLGISDEEVDPMERDGVGASGAASASDDRMLP